MSILSTILNKRLRRILSSRSSTQNVKPSKSSVRFRFLTANVSGKPRYEFLHGVRHLVVPVSMIQEGVLNGSKGALFYPQSEIGASTDRWNGMPIVGYHPQNKRGKPVSGRDPDILNKSGLGQIYRTDGSEGLNAEAWFNELTTKAFDRQLKPKNRIWNRLVKGRPVEVSTGLFTTDYIAPKGAKWNGKPFTRIATNYQPDHLAVLPDQKGACSNEDGCGIGTRRLRMNSCTDNSLTGLCENCGGVGGKPGPCPVKGSRAGSSEGLISRLRDKASRATYPKAAKGALLRAIISELKKPNLSNRDRSRYRKEAADIFGKYGGGDKNSSKMDSRQFHMYLRGLKPKTKLKSLLLKGTRKSSTMKPGMGNNTRNESHYSEGDDMPTTLNRRKQLAKLVENCSCFDEDDLNILAKFDPEKIDALIKFSEQATENALTVNAVADELGLTENEEGNEDLFEDDDEVLAPHYDRSVILKALKRNSNGMSKVDRAAKQNGKKKPMKDCLNDKDKMSSNARKKKAAESDDDDDDDDEEILEDEGVENSEAPETVEEWLKTSKAPPSVVATFNQFAEMEREQKKVITRKLVANVKDRKKAKTMAVNLMKRDLNDLKERLEYLPAESKEGKRPAVYVGNNANWLDGEDDVEEPKNSRNGTSNSPLPLIDMDFKRNGILANARKRKSAGKVTVPDDDDGELLEDMTDGDDD